MQMPQTKSAPLQSSMVEQLATPNPDFITPLSRFQKLALIGSGLVAALLIAILPSTVASRQAVCLVSWTGAMLFSLSLLILSNQGIRAGRALLACVVILTLHGAVFAALRNSGIIPTALGCGLVVTIGTVSAFRAFRVLASFAPAPLESIVVCLIGALSILMVLYGSSINLLAEEAYYWQYSQHLDIGYLDHPPMVAWIIAFTTSLFGTNEFGVRIGAWLCWLGSSYFCYRITSAMFDRRSAYWAAALFATLPYFFGTGLLMTPDAPLVLCWSASLYFLYQALIEDKHSAWLTAGIFIGLGMLSKYTMVLVGGCAVLFALLDPKARKSIFRPQPWIAVVIAFAIFAPVIYWNMTHEWASFMFQGPRRFEQKPEFSTQWLLLHLLIILTPVGILTLPSAFRGLGTLAPNAASRIRLFVLIFTFTPVLLFTYVSFKHELKINWTGPAFLAVLPLLAHQASKTGKAWLATLAALIITYGVTLYYFSVGYPGVPYTSKMHKMLGWDDLAVKVNDLALNHFKESGKVLVLAGLDTHYNSSEMAFYLQKQAERASVPHAFKSIVGRSIFGMNSLMYQYWSKDKVNNGDDLLLLTRSRETFDDPQVTARLTQPGPIGQINTQKNGYVVGKFFYSIALGYVDLPK